MRMALVIVITPTEECVTWLNPKYDMTFHVMGYACLASTELVYVNHGQQCIIGHFPQVAGDTA